jgi:hypothetical protein
MKKLVSVLAALVVSVVSHQAMACDWGAHAANNRATVVVCDNNGCAAVPTAQQAAAPEPARSTVANDAAPVIVADQSH